MLGNGFGAAVRRFAIKTCFLSRYFSSPPLWKFVAIDTNFQQFILLFVVLLWPAAPFANRFQFRLNRLAEFRRGVLGNGLGLAVSIFVSKTSFLSSYFVGSSFGNFV